MSDEHDDDPRRHGAVLRRREGGVRGGAPSSVGVPAGATVDDLLSAVRERHGGEFGRVLERCSFLLDEVAVRDRNARLGDGATIDVLPPFAGG